MLFARQRLLLSLLDALGGTVANTDFQKLLFLYAQEWETEPSYEFVPYQFGGFSFTSYAVCQHLDLVAEYSYTDYRNGLLDSAHFLGLQARVKF